MADFDREKLSKILEDQGVNEEFFISELVSMAKSKGMNKSVALRMIGELKGLNKKEDINKIHTLAAFGADYLINTVQSNRRNAQKSSIELAEIFTDEGHDEN